MENKSISFYNSLVKKMQKNYKKMIKKPPYKILLFIFGVLTFIFVYLKHISLEKNNEYEKLKNQVYNELERNGMKDVLNKEATEHLKNKLNFLNKNMDNVKFENEVKKIANRQFEDIVNDKVYKKTLGTDIKSSDIHDTYCDMLSSKLFFAVSFIISIPMYLLMIIYANPYAKYIFERIVMMVFVIFGVTFLVFTILYFSPSDPAKNVLGDLAIPEQVETFKKVYGLDQPYIVQLWTAFKKIMTFDLGKSYVGNEDVLIALSRKFPVTLQITFASLFVSIALSIIPGIISAMKQYSSFDYIFMLIALLGLSIPNFWLGLILILQFSIKLGWVPATYSAQNLATIIMPAIVIGTGMSATIARLTRSSMLEIKNQDYILTAKAKGLNNRTVIFKHILANAMIPIVTAIGLQFGGLLGGSSVTEKVFNISGIGSFIVDKQFIPDIPVVLSGVVYIAIIISLVNLAVDIMYAFLDPRIKSKMKSY